MENRYQARLIKKLRNMFPGCMILKNDTGYMQGLPDLTILYGPHWATLEVKDSETSAHQPNQDWYVEQMDAMSFSAFIYPSNERRVLHELQQALHHCQPARFSQR